MSRVDSKGRFPKGLADLLLYDSLIDDGVLLLQDGALLAAWSFRGPDLQAATHEEMQALSTRLNSLLRLGTGWMIQVDLIRSESPGYPPDQKFPDATTRLIDEERREQFMREGTHFETECVLSLTFLPPAIREEKIRGWLFTGAKKDRDGVAKRVLESFKGRISAFEDVFKSLFNVKRLRAESGLDSFGAQVTCDELLRYIHRTITFHNHPLQCPDVPIFLNDTLASEDFVAGTTPRIGQKHLRVLAIDGFPKMSHPGILAALDSLPFPYRWNTRAILMDPEEARSFLQGVRARWKSKIRGFKDQIMKTENGPIDLHAQEMFQDAEQAMSSAGAGDVYFAQYSSVVVCAHNDADRADENAAEVAKTIRNLGFAVRREDINAVDAWRGSLPGNGYSNVRRVLLHTMNLADLLPTSSVWAGHSVSPCPFYPPNSPPLFYANTTGSTPYRFNLHVGDMGHQLVLGPTGSGKSTLLQFMVAQFFRYPRSRVVVFDKGYSSFLLVSACGGNFFDVGAPEGAPSFYPLGDLSTNADASWAVGWIEKLVCMSGLKSVTPAQRNAITQAVNLLRESPRRTITDLKATVQDMEIRAALETYALGGPLGSLLDSDSDGLQESRFMVFEMEHLMRWGGGVGVESDRAVVSVLLYLFRRIEKNLDGSPTLIILDEAWLYFRDPLFLEYIRQWLATLRKLNGAVVIATQNPGDVVNSAIAPLVLQSCQTLVLLANPRAGSEQFGKLYQQLGLNQAEIELLQRAIPKREYYVSSPDGKRMIYLGLGDVALSFVGVGSPDDRKKAKELMARHPADWPARWLASRKVQGWGDYWRELSVADPEVALVAD